MKRQVLNELLLFAFFFLAGAAIMFWVWFFWGVSHAAVDTLINWNYQAPTP